jgi:hypothetical protein
MALEGTLRDFSLADIFQLIGLQRKTGVLTLKGREDVVTISFLDGKVVGADSVNKRIEDRLGQVLLKTGTVSQTELDAALRTQMETLERLGHILIRHTVISRDELRKALEKQVLQIIYRVFRWQDGDYHFSQETTVDYDSELFSPMSAESILMEGARMLDEWPIIEKKIPHRGLVFVPTQAAQTAEVVGEQELEEIADFELDAPPPPTPTGGRIKISPVERDILVFANGVNDVEEIVRKSAHGEFETCKAIYTLLTRSLLRQATRDELARAAQKASAATRTVAPVPRLPWLAAALIPLLALSMLIAPRNPLNPVLGPSHKLAPRLVIDLSWARMFGLWKVMQSRNLLLGSYPDTLADLVTERLVRQDLLQDPWKRTYRYVLRDQSMLLAGSNAEGIPDPNLILSQHLGSGAEELEQGPGASLLTP